MVKRWGSRCADVLPSGRCLTPSPRPSEGGRQRSGVGSVSAYCDAFQDLRGSP